MPAITLSHKINDKEHVIAYMSKALNKHEMSYCVTRKELLAVVRGFKNFHSYLNGQEVVLRTDNAAVSWMKSLKNSRGQCEMVVVPRNIQSEGYSSPNVISKGMQML